ncbi:hypothetical protein [Amycolatopsis sp. lyj-23]|uniref:hypothetical protein n=1 Tax=Amycolatopsis sp. lyj-23 TaxID=2789283 RepID=UPI0039783F46
MIGYSAEECTRAKRDLVYATDTRTPVHPLIEWGWTRAACSARLLAEFGITWQKPACTFCCYSGGRSLTSTLKRMRDHPEEAALALLIEDGNTRSVELFRHRLKNRALGRLRRPPHALRGQTGPRPQGHGVAVGETAVHLHRDAARARLAAVGGDHPIDEDGRVWLRPHHDTAPYPKAEQFLVATAAGAAELGRLHNLSGAQLARWTVLSFCAGRHPHTAGDSLCANRWIRS